MNKGKLRPELELMLRLSHPSCTEQKAHTLLSNLPVDFDWQYFIDRAIATHFAGYLLPYPTLNETFYPEGILKKIKAYQHRILLHGTLLREACLKIATILNQEKKPYAILKGFDLHFRNSISLKTRQISDIDILIDENDLESIAHVLEAQGYTIIRHQYKSKWHQQWLKTHAPMSAKQESVSIDIHTNAVDQVHQIPFEINLKELSQISVNGTQVNMLAPEVSNLFLKVHAYKHLNALSNLKPSMLIDLYQLNQSTAAKENELNKMIYEMDGFTNRVHTLNFNQKHLFDQFFLKQLAGEKLNLTFRIKRIFKRLRPVKSIYKSIVLLYFDLFPQKSFLIYRFGNGNYVLLLFKRIFDAFGKSYGEK